MTADKTKLRALAQASIDHGIEQGSGDGWFSADHMLRYCSTDLEDGLVVEHATPQTIIVLLDELQAMTTERDGLKHDIERQQKISAELATENDNLRALILAHLALSCTKSLLSDTWLDSEEKLRKAVES